MQNSGAVVSPNAEGTFHSVRPFKQFRLIQRGVQFRKWQELWPMESGTCTLGGAIYQVAGIISNGIKNLYPGGVQFIK